MCIIIHDTLYIRYQSLSGNANVEEMFRLLRGRLLWRQQLQRDSQITEHFLCWYKSCSSAVNVGIVTATSRDAGSSRALVRDLVLDALRDRWCSASGRIAKVLDCVIFHLICAIFFITTLKTFCYENILASLEHCHKSILVRTVCCVLFIKSPHPFKLLSFSWIERLQTLCLLFVYVNLSWDRHRLNSADSCEGKTRRATQLEMLSPPVHNDAEYLTECCHVLRCRGLICGDNVHIYTLFSAWMCICNMRTHITT